MAITAQGLENLGFTSLVDFVLQDDGAGVFIAEWNSASPQPSVAEIEAAEVEWQTAYDAQAYARDRQARYNAELPMGDQFDAILKGFNQLRFNGQDLPADLDEVIGIWLGIKSAIPKE